MAALPLAFTQKVQEQKMSKRRSIKVNVLVKSDLFFDLFNVMSEKKLFFFIIKETFYFKIKDLRLHDVSTHRYYYEHLFMNEFGRKKHAHYFFWLGCGRKCILYKKEL